MNSITISTVVNNDMRITVATDGNITAFAGVAKNNTLNIERSVDRVSELLVRAVNNRTRERNFFRLYADMLEQNITEEEYLKQLEEQQDEYVLPLPVEADLADIETAVQLSRQIKDVETTDDFQSLFSFSDGSIQRVMTTK